MMRLLRLTAILLLGGALAACGVDGLPIKPGPKPEQSPKPGISISGRVEAGVAKRSQ